jgi:hypothetical protein
MIVYNIVLIDSNPSEIISNLVITMYEKILAIDRLKARNCQLIYDLISNIPS